MGGPSRIERERPGPCRKRGRYERGCEKRKRRRRGRWGARRAKFLQSSLAIFCKARFAEQHGRPKGATIMETIDVAALAAIILPIAACALKRRRAQRGA